jgi:hypothetical protein
MGGALATIAYAQSAYWSPGGIRHVLLISIDGMHAVDYLNCSRGVEGVNDGEPYCPNLASLGQNGVNYLDTRTSKPSDSFPGIMALVSGGSPRTVGAFYDVAYDRSLDPPAMTTGNGLAAGPCEASKPPTGTTTEYEEGIDRDQTKLNGGAPGAGLTDGGIASIQPLRLIRDPAKGCQPVWPWQFVRTNTIFGVIHAAGGYTAWSDKHPAYSVVAGQGGPSTVDDYYSPEVNSTVIALPGVTTPLGMSCASIPDPTQTGAWTDSFANIQCYDTVKVNAVLNWIRGKTHDGKPARVPNIFGMNFQSVSVGEKLVEKSTGQTGGYTDAMATPSAPLLQEIKMTDTAIGEMMSELQSNGLYESTLVIVTAKHGQSPIDPHGYHPVPGPANVGNDPASILAAQTNVTFLPYSESPANPTGIGPTEDDVALLWLTSPSLTTDAVNILEANRTTAGIGEIYAGPTLEQMFNAPGLPPNGDPRSPDIVITPDIGVTYTTSSKKSEEHGGFSHDDINVMLLVSNPRLTARTVTSAVQNAQVAPTILKALNLNPAQLDAVRLEGTPPLPDIPYADLKFY